MSSVNTNSTSRLVPHVERAIAARLRSENNFNPCGVPRHSQRIADRWLAMNINSVPYMNPMEKCQVWVETKEITSHLLNNQR
ncbi:hypothetical protein L5515_017936 [Caenorhabditis briggsae]|uniref:Uncharacterized protein n=1 Tax=Caenorhabditis briggsae TaxID=6238 RepID=A0AAE9FAY6_CAEBR|nr:hypothetical protein L5515_017936 [Caenorhabditis briggsae]